MRERAGRRDSVSVCQSASVCVCVCVAHAKSEVTDVEQRKHNRGHTTPCTVDGAKSFPDTPQRTKHCVTCEARCAAAVEDRMHEMQEEFET